MGNYIAFIVVLCISCNKKLKDMIGSTLEFPGVLIPLSSFGIIGIIAFVLYFISVRHRHKEDNAQITDTVPLTYAGVLLGMGIGGFIDGIFLHQILQWHEMLTNRLPAISIEAKGVNMFWDGLFHAFTLLVVILGVMALWKMSLRPYAEKSAWLLNGGFLCGWAVFNLVEGIINHHILKLHNVRDNVADPDMWNYAFLLLSAMLLIAGWLLLRYYKRVTK